MPEATKASFRYVYSKVHLEDVLNFSKHRHSRTKSGILKIDIFADMGARTHFEKLTMSSKCTFEYTDLKLALGTNIEMEKNHILS